MKGRITFWCSFSNNSGLVAYRLYGQQCDSCQGDSYEPAMWYPEEIEKVSYKKTKRMFHTRLYFMCFLKEKDKLTSKILQHVFRDQNSL